MYNNINNIDNEENTNEVMGDDVDNNDDEDV